MFTEKNLLYYSSNKELERPEAESETDAVGELHTATEVIAQVEDEEGAQEIVKRVNMHNELIKAITKALKFHNKQGQLNSEIKTELRELVEKAQQKPFEY